METTNVAKQNLNKLIKDLQNNRMEMNFNFNTATEAADFCNLINTHIPNRALIGRKLIMTFQNKSITIVPC